MIDISGMDKAEVLASLYNNSKPLGLGNLHFVPDNMTREEAQKLLQGHTYFDYLRGRVMKVNLKGDSFEERLYDRDNGPGAARQAIERLKESNHETV